MECKRCGMIINDVQVKVCPKCGNILSEDKVNTNTDNNDLLKVFLIVFFSVFIAFLVLGVTLIKTKDSYLEKTEDRTFVVRNSTPSDHPTITYGDAFDNFFSDGEWEFFESDKHEDVVEFNGRCEYRETEVKAKIQFVLFKNEDDFEISFLSFNDVPQDNLTMIALMDAVFEDYD